MKVREAVGPTQTFCDYPNLNRLWKGYICPDCSDELQAKKNIIEERNRLFKSAEYAGESELKECSGCLQITTRFYEGINSHGSGVYRATDSRLWHGKRCPDCYAKDIQRKRQLRKPPKSPLKKICEGCANEFETFRPNQLTCSASCRTKKSQKRKGTACRTCGTRYPERKGYCSAACKPIKPKISKAKGPQDKSCLTCGENFKGYANQFYCKPGHSPAAKKRRKRAKAIRKARCKQGIAKKLVNELVEVYANANGLEVDHIIPINHPEVCGLHVPWNLQYLDNATNGDKSNLWDGTMNNTNWRKLLKPL